jgi:outer membrane protein TolC
MEVIVAFLPKTILVTSLLSLSLFASALSEDLLSDDKAKELELKQQQNDVARKIQRDSWIEVIGAQYQETYSNQFDNESKTGGGGIGIDQDIFRSGGIFYSIKYASAAALYKSLGLKMEKQALIKQVVSLIMQLRILDFQLEKAKFSVEDAKAGVDYKQSLLSAGEIDIGQFHSSRIDYNNAQVSFESLVLDRANLMQTLTQLSAADYKTVKLPHLKLLDKETFLGNHIELDQVKANIKQKDYAKKVAITNYLPKFSIQASYNYTVTEDLVFGTGTANTIPDNEEIYQSYGFKIEMPIFDINMLRNFENATIDKMNASVQLSQKEHELKNFYKTTQLKVDSINKQAMLATESISLYDAVLKRMKSLVDAGEEDSVNLQVTEHEMESKKVDLKIYALQKDMEILNLYEKIYNKDYN